MKINSKKDSKGTANNNRTEEVNDFVYHGSKITANGDSTVDVRYRITKARANFANLWNIWKSSNIRIQTKISIFKTHIMHIYKTTNIKYVMCVRYKIAFDKLT